MPLEPIDLLEGRSRATDRCMQLADDFTPVLAQHQCQFSPDIFLDVILNVLRNPNITSSHLFRADVLYDSREEGILPQLYPGQELSNRLGPTDAISESEILGFERTRTLIRSLIPRNPQLDKPLNQSCHFFHSKGDSHIERYVVVCIPHVSSVEAIPWYHPSVRALAYLYEWHSVYTVNSPANDGEHPKSILQNKQGTLSVHYRLFTENDLPLSQRLQRTAYHLLATVYKHGQGRLAGYKKKFHHDLLISQARVQNTYAGLKRRHAKRLCETWVEVTEPSKHVFEDLAIAAFLIELWREMYRDPPSIDKDLPDAPVNNERLPTFPGFVDIGCGNGVLTEVLLRTGYNGWGFDARRRKTWSVLSSDTQRCLKEMILVPQPLLSEVAACLPTTQIEFSKTNEVSTSDRMFSRVKSAIFSAFTTSTMPGSSSDSPIPHPWNDQHKWHNGLFKKGTFVISNHADELTAWTPLLASLSSSPFLAIPCCSHNLSGTRFRAPSLYTNFTADAAAPQYFAKDKLGAGQAKHIAIQVPTAGTPIGWHERRPVIHTSSAVSSPTGDLNALSQAARTKQPSAYASLCDWVAYLANEVGFEVEKEMLRIPSTRNVGIVGRRWKTGQSVHEGGNTMAGAPDKRIDLEQWNKVQTILQRENPDRTAWIRRARDLMSGNDRGTTVHG